MNHRPVSARTAPAGPLNIEIRAAHPHEVVGELRVQPDLAGADNSVDDSVIMTFGDQLARHAASGALKPPGGALTTLESKTTFFRPCRTRRIVGVAQPLHGAANLSLWRVRVSDAGTNPVAEITQTFVLGAVDSGSREDPTAESTDRDAPKAAVPLAARSEKGPRGVAQERREQIFRGACEVIARKGFANASVRDIAAAAGMPVPTMYQYIDSKEDLVVFIYEHFMDDVNRRISAKIGPRQTPTEKLVSAIQADIESNDRNHRYVKLMFQETRALNAKGRERLNAQDSAHIELLRQILDEGATTGEFDLDDPELVANYIFFLCAIWTLRYWSIGRHGVESITDSVSRFVLRAVSAPSDAAERPASAEQTRKGGKGRVVSKE